MTALVTWFTETGHTYQLERYVPGTLSWTIVVSTLPAASVPYTDTAGVPADYYRVCDDTNPADPSPYTPRFHGAATFPSTTTVYGYVMKSDGTPIQDSVIEFRVTESQNLGGSRISESSYSTTFTNELGYWEQDLIQSLRVYVRIPDVELYAEITVPTVGPVSLESLL